MKSFYFVIYCYFMFSTSTFYNVTIMCWVHYVSTVVVGVGLVYCFISCFNSFNYIHLFGTISHTVNMTAVRVHGHSLHYTGKLYSTTSIYIKRTHFGCSQLCRFDVYFCFKFVNELCICICFSRSFSPGHWMGICFRRKSSNLLLLFYFTIKHLLYLILIAVWNFAYRIGFVNNCKQFNFVIEFAL